MMEREEERDLLVEAVAAVAAAANEIPVLDMDPAAQRDDEESVVSLSGDPAADEEADTTTDAPLLLQPLHNPYCPTRMQLSPQEQQWALRIKEAIEAIPDIDNLCDFRYAQLAILEQNDLNAALDRALQLQLFREEYDIKDNLQDSQNYLQRLVDLFPRMFMSFSFHPEDGNYYLVYDITQFSVREMTSTRQYTSWNAGVYYLCHCMSVDFELIRQGVKVLCECQGYDWTRNVNAKIFERDWLFLAKYYPLQFQSMRHFHPSVIYNMFVAMIKRLVPKRMAEKFGTQGQDIDARLDEIYLVPTQQAANQRLLDGLQQILTRRYQLEEVYTLED